jgi:hypothetical protein
MSEDLLALLKLLLVFGLVIGFGLHQIWGLKRDREQAERERRRDADEREDPRP